jgi:hypothetical protein
MHNFTWSLAIRRGDVVMDSAEAATKMFSPILEALEELSDEFSGSSGIRFSTSNPPNSCAIHLGTKIRSYTIPILCGADTVENGFSFSYKLIVSQDGKEGLLYSKSFETGEEKLLLDTLIFILIDYEVHGFILPEKINE